MYFNNTGFFQVVNLYETGYTFRKAKPGAEKHRVVSGADGRIEIAKQ